MVAPRRRIVAVTALAVSAGLAAPVSASPIRIVQVYGGGGNPGASYNRDFVVLHNASASPIDLATAGLSLQHALPTDGGFSRSDLSGVIQPGAYYLIALGLNPSGSTPGSALPGPDLTPTSSLFLGNINGKLALVRSATTITATPCPVTDPTWGSLLVDFVGYGTANCSEGGAPVGALANNLGAIRLGDGCTDTDNNAADFQVATPAPVNSGSVLACPPVPPGADLTITASASPVTTLPADAAYTFTVRNYGPDTATGVTLAATLPYGSAFVSSSVAGPDPVGGVLTRSLPDLLVGESAVVTVTVRPDGTGVYAMAATADASQPDSTEAFNNRAAASSCVLGARPGELPRTIFSTRLGFRSEPDPTGLPGGNFSGIVNRPFHSADGAYWLMAMDTDLPTANDAVLLFGQGDTWSVLFQEAVTPLDGGTMANFQNVAGVNNAGDVAFTAQVRLPDTTLRRVAGRIVGGVTTVVGRQGDTVPAFGAGTTYGTDMGSPTIQNDGTMSFYTSLVGPPVGQRGALLRNDGNTVVAQLGVTVPGNQIAPTQPYEFIGNTGFFGLSLVNAAGNGWVIDGILVGADASDRVEAVNGSLFAQEGSPAPGAGPTEPAASFPTFSHQHPNGHTYIGLSLAGEVSNSPVLAYRNGALVGRDGAPIAPGASERWVWRSTTHLLALNGDSRGNYVVGGATDHPDPRRNQVVLLNGTTVLIRKGDPIDLDGNGQFDDDAYIELFPQHRHFLADDGYFYFGVKLRSGDQLCANTAGTGEAFVRMRAVRCVADTDGNGQVQVADIFAFLSRWFAQDLAADTDGNGQVQVADIFAFLSLWFAGC